MKTNEVAPYEGILVPKSMYKEIMADIYAGDKFKDEFEKCANDIEQFKETENGHKVYYFTGGVLTVLAVEIILYSLLK